MSVASSSRINRAIGLSRSWIIGRVVGIGLALSMASTAKIARAGAARKAFCFQRCEAESKLSWNAWLSTTALKKSRSRWGSFASVTESDSPLFTWFQDLVPSMGESFSHGTINVSSPVLSTPTGLTAFDSVITEGIVARLPQLAATSQHEGKRARLSSCTSSRGLNDDTSFWLLPGSTYLSEMRIPIIGKQVFRLLITGSNTARLDIQGRILRIQDDHVIFSVDDQSGDISFVLSHATCKILRRFRTRLGRVAYDMILDEASLEVKPPLPTSIHLRFKRVV